LVLAASFSLVYFTVNGNEGILFNSQSGLGIAKAAFSEQPLSKYVNQNRQKKPFKKCLKAFFDQNSSIK
jgi:hypothetical protein